MVKAAQTIEQVDAREPWWIALLVRVGPVAALALGLAYFLATSVKADLQAMQLNQTLILQQLSHHMQDVALEKQYLRALCLNSAANNAAAIGRCTAIEPR